MEEQIISFETAKLAQEKGFDLNINQIGRNRINYYNYLGELNGDCTMELKHRKEVPNIYKSIAAPTQSLLQKWLRDVHNIDVWAQPFVSKTKKGDKYYLPDESYSYFIFKDGVWVSDEIDFLDFEEALEYGLYEALKLI